MCNILVGSRSSHSIIAVTDMQSVANEQGEVLDMDEVDTQPDETDPFWMELDNPTDSPAAQGHPPSGRKSYDSGLGLSLQSTTPCADAVIDLDISHESGEITEMDECVA